jgi:hypothetical protein
VLKVADPSIKDRVASVLDPSLTVTVPVGTKLFPPTYWTVADIVTAVPTFAGLGVAVSASASEIFEIVSVTGVDCDGVAPC